MASQHDQEPGKPASPTPTGSDWPGNVPKPGEDDPVASRDDAERGCSRLPYMSPIPVAVTNGIG